MSTSRSVPTAAEQLPPLTPEQGLACFEVAVMLSETTDREEIGRRLTRHGLEMLRSQRCTLFSYDPARILVPSLNGQAVPESALPTAQWPGHLPPMVEQAIRTRRPITWTGVEQPLDTASRSFAERTKSKAPPVSATTRAVRELLNDREALSALCVPLLGAGELSGLAIFYDIYPRDWAPADLALANRLGQLGGVALHTARRFERERRRRRAAEGLAEVATAITASLDLETILKRTAEYAAELLSAPLAGILVLDTAIGTAPVAHFGPVAYSTLWADCQRVIQQVGWIEHLGAGKVVYLTNSATERTAGEWFRERGIVSLLLAPLLVGERLVAMLGVAYTDSPHRFTKSEIDLVQQFAQQTAVAVANADEFRRQRRRADQMRSLAEVSAALSSTLDLDKVLRLILDQLGSVVEFDGAAIERLEGDTLTVIAEAGHGPMTSAPLRIDYRENHLARRVIEEQKPVVLGDVQRNPDFIRTDRRVRSWIGAPLLAANQPIGLLVVDSYHPDRYNEEDAEVVAQFARQAALAIERAQLFSAERAGRRQAALLLEMTRAVSASLDLDEVLTRAARDIAAAAGVIHCGVYLVDRRRPRLHLRASAGRAPKATVARPALIHSLHGTGEPLVLDPVSDGRIERNVARPMGLTSLLAVPFIHREQLVGVALAAAYDRPVRFDREQVELAQGIARSAAVAIENARLYQEQERRVAQLSALTQIGQATAALLQQDEIIQLVFEQTSRVLDTQNFYIALVDESRDEIFFAADTESARSADPPPTRLRRGEGLTWHVVATREPLYIRDGYREACERLGIKPLGAASRSWLGVPLVAGRRSFGAIVLQDYERDDAYDEDDVAVLTTIASQAAIALENARLFGLVQQRVQQLIGIASVGAALVQERDVDRVLGMVAEHIRGLTTAEHVLINLLTDDGRGLEVRMAVGPRADEMYRLHVPVEGSLSGLAITTKQPQLSPDTSTDPRVNRAKVELTGTRNLLIVPLVAQNRVIGVVTATNKHGGPFGAGDMETVSVMANLAAVAFENARLHHLTERRALELKALHEIGQSISRSLALDAVLDAIASAAVRLLQAEKSVLFLVEDGRLVARASDGLQTDTLGLRFEPRDSVAGYVARTGFPIIIHDVAQDGRVIRDVADAEDIRSLVEVPIRIGGLVTGVLVVGSMRARAFGDSHAALLGSLADQAAIAIDNARLYAQARELAVLEERNRLAREMHDTLAQGFTGIVLQLEAAEQVMVDDAAEALDHLNRARKLARDSLAEARRSVWNLRPRTLEQAGLRAAIRQAVADGTADGKVRSDFQVEGEPYPLPPEAENTLLRITQESLTNMRKHAQAAHVWIRLAYGADGVSLTLRDDGIGFDPNAIPSSRQQGGGLGLLGMHERAAAIGAALTVDSAPGRGTTIRVELPPPSRLAAQSEAVTD